MFKNLLTWYEKFMNEVRRDVLLNIGLLFLRIMLGTMMLLGHGWGKFVNFAEKSDTFADPLGIGSPFSLAFVVFAEVFCAILLVLGFVTRIVVIPLIITMLFAAFVIHGNDPWSRQEFAVLYLIPFIFLFLSGAGRFSIDDLILKKWGKSY